jgi:hypothetical protein
MRSNYMDDAYTMKSRECTFGVSIVYPKCPKVHQRSIEGTCKVHGGTILACGDSYQVTPKVHSRSTSQGTIKHQSRYIAPSNSLGTLKQHPSNTVGTIFQNVPFYSTDILQCTFPYPQCTLDVPPHDDPSLYLPCTAPSFGNRKDTL